MWLKGSGVDEGFHRLKIAAVLLVLGLGTGVAAAFAGVSFPDPVGDVKGGAGPDLTSISVSHTSSAVRFRLTFAKAPPLGVSVRQGWVDMLVIGIGVPPRGPRADYVVGLHGTERTAMLVRQPATKPGPGKVVGRPEVAVAGRTLSLSVSRGKLGDPAWIEFSVAAGRELVDRATGGGGDLAPDNGAFHYQLRR